MKSYQSKPEKRQLYFLIDALSSSVSNGSICDGIIGYSIAQGLGEYIAQEFGRQPKAHREIQAIYDSLEDSKESCLELSEDPNGLDSVLMQLKENVNPLINSYQIDKAKPKPESHLFEQMLSNISKQNKNIEAYLTNFGFDLSRSVSLRGILFLRENRVYNDDYKIVERSLSKRFVV